MRDERRDMSDEIRDVREEKRVCLLSIAQLHYSPRRGSQRGLFQEGKFGQDLLACRGQVHARC
jgi:hypothetical protein